jgi:uncharacterized protein YkwD
MTPVDVEETPREALARARRALAIVNAARSLTDRNPTAGLEALRPHIEAAIAAAMDLADAFSKIDHLLSWAPQPARRARRGGFFARFFAWLVRRPALARGGPSGAS